LNRYNLKYIAESKARQKKQSRLAENARNITFREPKLHFLAASQLFIKSAHNFLACFAVIPERKVNRFSPVTKGKKKSVFCHTPSIMISF
jgi:hypothetical protein